MARKLPSVQLIFLADLARDTAVPPKKNLGKWSSDVDELKEKC